MRAGLLAIASLAMAMGGSVEARPAPQNCAATPADVEAISTNIRAFYEALSNEDGAAIARLTTPSFYSYDAGKRYTGPQLSAVVTQAHQSGVTLEWNVGAFDVHVGCDMAWATWANTGGAGKAPALRSVSWLESGAFRRQNGRWLMEFHHSTPEPERK